MKRRHVFLVGMMGAGKSSAGIELAALLGMPFVDLDREVEAEAGRSVAEVFAEGGEDRFRELETTALGRAASGPASVVACGGGAVLRADNRELMRETGTVVYLVAPVGVLRERVGSGSRRPLIRAEGDLDRIAGEREVAYRAAAHHVVDASGPPPEVARSVAEALR